jgi:O-antigen biosynthesis protein
VNTACTDRRDGRSLAHTHALSGAVAVGSRQRDERPRVRGRSILCGEEKLHVRGVTYGTFKGVDGASFPPAEVVRRDLEAMAAAGVDCLRTYVLPPLWLLDMAHELGLRVMVGLACLARRSSLASRPAMTGSDRPLIGAASSLIGHTPGNA